jgi:hypothetical protein
VARFLFINVLAGLGVGISLQVAWYFIFSSYNRRRGAQALQWVDSACGGRARISEVRWHRGQRLLASVKFPLRGFENAHVTVRLRPRAVPVRWLFSWWKKQRETLTLDADLEQAPRVSLHVFSHRATYRNAESVPDARRDWEIVRSGALVLTTCERCREQTLPELNALMSARQNGFQQVEFRPVSPQFSATIELASLADPAAAAKFVASLRGIASGKSAQRQ